MERFCVNLKKRKVFYQQMQPHAHVKLKEATQIAPVTCLGMKILIDAKHQLVKTIRHRLEIQPPVFDPGLAECLLQRRHVLWKGSYPRRFKVEILPEANMPRKLSWTRPRVAISTSGLWAPERHQASSISSLSRIRPNKGLDMLHWFRQSSNIIVCSKVNNA
ncbi:unnamed protein product [Clavelina lepadiformis]|uniref:Uncharacterized protein n=1 Tax=Clavelina lepadiformis TaxID=159417 RepID=A0ABP0GEJ7_CLALP